MAEATINRSLKGYAKQGKAGKESPTKTVFDAEQRDQDRKDTRRGWGEARQMNERKGDLKKLNKEHGCGREEM